MSLNTDLITLFRRDLIRTKKEIIAFRNEAHLWVIKDGVLNSSGHLALHIAGNIQHYIGGVLGKSGYVRDRHAEFNAKGLHREDIIRELDQAIQAVELGLSDLSDEQWKADFHKPPFAVDTTREFILHLYGHMNYHFGQLQYLRRILEPS